MKHKLINARRRREAGAALITAIMVSLCTAMLLAASLTVALTTSELGWKQSSSEAALQLADAGINSELQYIALNVSASTTTGRSSQPVVSAGVTVTLPNVSTAVLGRSGTVPGYSGGTYYVYSSNNAAGTVAWDGVTSPFYVTCSATVGGVWQTVQIQSSSTSLFNVYGIFALGSYPSAPTALTVAPSATVNVGGSAGINGTISKGSGCTFKSPCAINANCSGHSSGQFDSTCVSSGGQLCSVQPPLTYPRTATCCKNCFGLTASTTDAAAYSYCASHSCNSSCVYQYTSTATSSTISTHNCCPLSGGCGTKLNNNCFNNANTCPGTYTSDYWYWWDPPTVAVQTLIFEPGDYYFTQCQLQYNAGCQMIIDPCAYASGGTPGQVRFWMYDPNSSTDGNPSDYCQLPITNTCAAGSSTPDPGQFRIYYGKDACTCTFTRPSNVTDWTGNTLNGDFNYYCGLYACTKQPNDTSSSVGTCCAFQGCSTSSAGRCNLCGSMLCDKLSFSGCCNPTYVQSQTCTKDPCSGGSCNSWSCTGG